MSNTSMNTAYGLHRRSDNSLVQLDDYLNQEFDAPGISNAGDSQLAGGNIWPLSSQDSAQVGDVGLVDVLYLRDSSGSPSLLYQLLDGPASGDITAISFDNLTATIGGVDYTMFLYRFTEGERSFTEFGGRGDYLIADINQITKNMEYRTTNSIINPNPTDNSDAMAAAMAEQKIYGFKLLVEPGHYYFTKKTTIDSAFFIESRCRSYAFNYLQNSDCIFYLDSADSNESLFEFTADVANQTNRNMQGSTLKNLFFKQLNQTTTNQHMIRCHNVGWSYSTFKRLTFLDTTGYGMYFISDFNLPDAPASYQTTYFQNVDFEEFSFQRCGGTIGGNEVSDRIATKGKLKSWNCEGFINQVSPQPWFLNMRGMKDYDLDNVIMEGGDGTGVNSLIKIGNFANDNDTFRSQIKGLWIEYLQNPTLLIIAGQCDLELYNLNTSIPTSQADNGNLISFTKPYSRAKFTRSNLFPWRDNLCRFNGLQNNIDVELDGCNIRNVGDLLKGTLSAQNRYKIKNSLSELGGRRVFSDFVTNATMFEWDGATTTGSGVVNITNNADTINVVNTIPAEGNVIEMVRNGAFITFQLNISLSSELLGQDLVVGWRLKTDYPDAKLAINTSASNAENVTYINQTIDSPDDQSFVNCYAVLGNISNNTLTVNTLPLGNPPANHTLWISDIIVIVGDKIHQLIPGRV